MRFLAMCHNHFLIVTCFCQHCLDAGNDLLFVFLLLEGLNNVFRKLNLLVVYSALR